MKIAEPVLAVLSRSVMDGPTLVLPEQLDRKLYVDVAKVLEAAGGKWQRKAKAHVFPGSAEEAIEPLLLTGEYARTKQDFGQFDTPAAALDILLGLVDIRAGQTVLEPSVGTGQIARMAEAQGAIVTAYEIDEKRLASAKSACVLKGGAHHGDFLAQAPTSTFDRVVMNPPFARRADIHHVRHALSFVKPSGRLVSVMSAGVLFREDRLSTEFRSVVSQKGGGFQPLPENSFKESGTSVNACIVVIPN